MQNQIQGLQYKKPTTQTGAELKLNSSFLTYLERFHLSLSDVAHASGVRLPTVWRITHRLPISTQHAEQIRKGIQKLTNTIYTGPIDVLLLEMEERSMKQ